ncbi:cell division cycle-associated 7-like protein [Ptiloglossa arizonensis]|uniref:cell division cycle-associated 7-like protein n=1 Tax=Ptiloglossa arizonensis TaxID=3350558 RepID=UPI003F9F2B9B
MSEDNYDYIRKKNIAERNAIFAEIFKDFKKQTTEIEHQADKYRATDNLENEPPRKRRRTISTATRDSYRINNAHLKFHKKYNTRSRAKSLNKDDPDISRNERDQEEEEYNDNDFYKYTKKKKVHRASKSPYDPDSVPSVDEITDDMLNNVAVKSSLKQYSRINGTSCHQCRQKTLDTKTVCRSGECIGVRGQFCGPCLRGRYGESAVEALKDPNWICPPCRDLCNCSICRTRSGLRPTGILAPVVQGEGYSSVMDYLNATDRDDT